MEEGPRLHGFADRCGLPLNALSTMIEANLRQRIGEDYPEITGEGPTGILM